jgi:hypothetical protein
MGSLKVLKHKVQLVLEEASLWNLEDVAEGTLQSKKIRLKLNVNHR